jgi:hypothetical protein
MGATIQIADWQHERQQRQITNDAENTVRQLLSRCFVLRQKLFTGTKEECLAIASEVFDVYAQAFALAIEHELAIMQQADGKYSVGRYVKE